MRMQPESIVDVLILDVLLKVYVRRNAQPGGATAPFDLKGAVRFDLGKGGDGALIGSDMAVASNALPSAAGGENDERRED